MMRRNAISMVEVLVVFSIGSTVLALAVGTVHRAMLVTDTAQNYSQQSLHWNRFLEQFRDDVHLGADIELHSDQSLTIELVDKSKIAYTIDTNRIARTVEISEDDVVRETIRLASNHVGSFDFDEASQTASLRIHRNLELQPLSPLLERSVEAKLARTQNSYSIREAKP